MVIVQSDTHRQTINLDLNLRPYTNVNSWPPKHDSWFIKEKINKLHFIKEKNFFSVKDPVKTMKRLATDWKKTFARHASDKGLVSSIYKEISKLKSKKANNLIRKWVKHMKRLFAEEDTQMEKQVNKKIFNIISH